MTGKHEQEDKETEYELGDMKAKATTDMGLAISIWVCVVHTWGMLG